MLKINLLSEVARKTALSPVEQFHRTPLMWLFIGGMVCAGLAFLAPILLYRQQLQQLNAKILVLEPKKQEVDQLQRLLQQLRAQEEAFRGLGQGKAVWSKWLNTLSDVTPDGIWFTELALEEGKHLTIQGAAIGSGGTEATSINRLIQSLKDDPRFASFQLESMKRVPEKELEIVQFTLTCPLSTGQAPQ